MLQSLAVVVELAIIGAAVWVWRWDPRPGAMLTQVAHLPGFARGWAIVLTLAAVAWPIWILSAFRG